MNGKHLGFFVKLSMVEEDLQNHALGISTIETASDFELALAMNNTMVSGCSLAVKDCAALNGKLMASLASKDGCDYTVCLGDSLFYTDRQIFLKKSTERTNFNVASWFDSITGYFSDLKTSVVAEGLNGCIGFLFKRFYDTRYEFYLYFPRFQPSLFQPYDLIRDHLNEDLKSAPDFSVDPAIDLIVKFNNYLVNTREQDSHVVPVEVPVAEEKTDGC